MITGEKVQLKGMTRDSASQLYTWVNEEELRPYTGTVYPVSEYEHERWMETVSTDPGRRQFLICKRGEEGCIGTIGLKNFDWIGRQAELYISIGRKGDRGHGYGCDAVKTLVRFAFEQLNLHRIYLHVFASNQSAIRCYEKAGFTAEGILRQQHFSGGKYENTVLMAVLAPEI